MLGADTVKLQFCSLADLETRWSATFFTWKYMHTTLAVWTHFFSSTSPIKAAIPAVSPVRSAKRQPPVTKSFTVSRTTVVRKNLDKIKGMYIMLHGLTKAPSHTTLKGQFTRYVFVLRFPTIRTLCYDSVLFCRKSWKIIACDVTEQMLLHAKCLFLRT